MGQWQIPVYTLLKIHPWASNAFNLDTLFVLMNLVCEKLVLVGGYYKFISMTPDNKKRRKQSKGLGP